MDSAPGIPRALAPGLHCLLAPNPGPMTQAGTNSYLLGDGPFVVIDPGPEDPAHLAALLDATRGAVSHILITHAHRDHSALAPRLAQATGAPVLAFGAADAGRSARMAELAARLPIGGGEGVDSAFRPTAQLSDDQRIATPAGPITALWTPGHFAGHLAFAWRDRLFSGDLVMGWASTLISPPDGDLAAFMTSCARLAAHPARRFHPGHGPEIEDPAARIADLVAHREARSAAILSALAQGPATLPALTAVVYADTPPQMHAAAARNLLAHLIALSDAGAVEAHPALVPEAEFALKK